MDIAQLFACDVPEQVKGAMQGFDRNERQRSVTRRTTLTKTGGAFA